MKNCFILFFMLVVVEIFQSELDRQRQSLNERSRLTIQDQRIYMGQNLRNSSTLVHCAGKAGFG